ncbi:MAG: septal ring lytic transglycosylase RlpA family protein [Acidobacteria bacterium]|nr:septal ring lytic transglycosylase RlpA family protein [Acidobacteriota bacterium]
MSRSVAFPELRPLLRGGNFGNGGYLMLTRIARVLTMVVLVGWGAAQDPASSHQASLQPAPVEKTSAGRRVAKPNTQPYQVGTASWYGEDFEGKPTASGEPYNMYDLTAAHPSLPLGTFVKVTNLENRRTVVVRINDRGPVVPGRIIDVSYSAARVLEFEEHGIQQVRLDVVRPHRLAMSMAMLHEPKLDE